MTLTGWITALAAMLLEAVGLVVLATRRRTDDPTFRGILLAVLAVQILGSLMAVPTVLHMRPLDMALWLVMLAASALTLAGVAGKKRELMMLGIAVMLGGSVLQFGRSVPFLLYNYPGTEMFLMKIRLVTAWILRLAFFGTALMLEAQGSSRAGSPVPPPPPPAYGPAGGARQQMNFCGHCGNPVNPSTPFCSRCGQWVKPA